MGKNEWKQYAKVLCNFSLIKPCSFRRKMRSNLDEVLQQRQAEWYWGLGNLTNLRAENPGQICANPIAVEARLADGRPAAASGNKITISPLGGLVCQNCYQPKSVKKCNDFKIRFLCLL